MPIQFACIYQSASQICKPAAIVQIRHEFLDVHINESLTWQHHT